MKKSRIYIAIICMVTMAAAVAVVSCKKDTTNETVSGTIESPKAFDPSQITDMNAYLKDFKQKMQSAVKGEDETLSLEEAAWHLSSVANYDFANANVRFTDLRYDTLYYQVSAINGRISLNDLNNVYQSIVSDIEDFYQSLDLNEKYFRFIGASISEDGVISIELITSFVWLDHTWYFDSFYQDTICDYYFSEDSVYIWNQLGANELERLANLLEGRDYILPGESSASRLYYVYSMDVIFDFQNNIDPYGSPFTNNSRIFIVHDDTFATPAISKDVMCYCLDSYLGLPFEYVLEHSNLGGQRPVHWHVEGLSQLFPNDHFCSYYHRLTVKLAYIIATNDPIN